MNGSRFSQRLALPASLQQQLKDFRRRVWTIKMIEAGCGAIVGVLVSYLAVFVIHRVIDTTGLGPVGNLWPGADSLHCGAGLLSSLDLVPPSCRAIGTIDQSAFPAPGRSTFGCYRTGEQRV